MCFCLWLSGNLILIHYRCGGFGRSSKSIEITEYCKLLCIHITKSSTTLVKAKMILHDTLK